MRGLEIFAINQAPLNAEQVKTNGQFDKDAEQNATAKKIGPAFHSREELEVTVISNALLLLVGELFVHTCYYIFYQVFKH